MTKALLFCLTLAASIFTQTTSIMASQNRIDIIRPDAPELAAFGASAVGVHTLEVLHRDQVDILNVKPGGALPRYDRPLKLEVWYPAETTGQGTEYRVFLRDGKTEVGITGRAVRDAPAKVQGGPYPLVVISHGYPGNRFLMAHLGENLASKGYVVVSIDHTDSTYNDRGALGSTLVNRPIDQAFVIDEIARMAGESGNVLSGLVDASRTGVIGYSMGGYGAMITAGAGVTPASVGFEWGAPAGTLAVHQAGTETHAAAFDPRVKTVIAIAPWGMQRGLWDDTGLAEVKVPVFLMSGSVDDVSDYENGIRPLFEGVRKVDRYLLTFENANHNAAAPMPAPVESYAFNAELGFAPFEHYADPVWDTVRMNNIAQHFATAWLDLQLKGEADKRSYLDLVERSEDGVWAQAQDGTFEASHTYWKGFDKRTAKGLRLEHRTAD